MPNTPHLGAGKRRNRAQDGVEQGEVPDRRNVRRVFSGSAGSKFGCSEVTAHFRHQEHHGAEHHDQEHHHTQHILTV